AHAAETLMGRFRDGQPVTREAVTVVLATIDRIKEILAALESNHAEPEGSDEELVKKLERLAGAARAEQEFTVGTLVQQALDGPLRPGEVSLDELERAFRETPGPDTEGTYSEEPEASSESEKDRRAETDRRTLIRRDDEQREAAAKAKTLRVQVETLERLMT